MKKHLNSIKYLLVLMMLGLATNARAQLQNGDFEISNPLAANFQAVNFTAPPCPNSQDFEFYQLWLGNNLPNWQFQDTVDLHDRNHWNMGGNNNQHLDLNRDGFVSQTVSGLTIGRNYTVSIITSAHACLNNNDQVTATFSVRDLVGNFATSQNWTVTKVGNGCNNPMGWQNRTFNFTANASSQIIQFAGFSTPAGSANLGVLLDDVRLAADSTPCNEGIIPTRIDCNNYNFQLTEVSTFIRHARWTVNGVYAGEGTSIDLNFPQPGTTYTICVNYFGVHRDDTTQTCCGRGCYTITIPPIQMFHEVYQVCDLDQDSSVTFLYDSFTSFGGLRPPNFSYYLLFGSDGNLIYDSRNGGPQQHLFTPGTYSFDYYDTNGCVFARSIVQVNMILPQVTTCNIYRLVECGDDYNVDTSWRRSSCCTGNFTDSSDWYDLIDSTYINPFFSELREPQLIRKIFWDSIACRICIVRVNIGILRHEIVRYVSLNPCVCTNYSFAQLQALIRLNAGGYCTEDIDSATSFTIRNVGLNTTININSSGSFTACPGDQFEIGMSGNYGNGCCVFRFYFVCAGAPIQEGQNGERMGNFDYLFKNVRAGQPSKAPAIEEFNKPNNETDLSSNLALSIVPSPTSSVFKIHTMDGRIAKFKEVTVRNSVGQVVLTVNKITSNYQFDLTPFSDDIYFVSIEIENARQTLKVIKGN